MKKNDQAHLTVDIDKELHRQLKIIAINNETSLRKIVLDAIEFFIKEYVPKQKDKY